MALASPVNFCRTAIIFIASVRALNSAITPIVDLGYAQYQGVANTDLDITSFQEFAMHPLQLISMSLARTPLKPRLVEGILRWKAPLHLPRSVEFSWRTPPFGRNVV
ncbi:hypothetical protein C8R44DRAFT_957352 [Mycena epipterygia]|nr:hypothetical protein C8R44DRAFT_957352 [Mycena epipterygia]